MRYFLISFYYKDNFGNDGFNEISFPRKEFPSKQYIEAAVQHRTPKIVSVRIMNIFEFANSTDYCNFIKEV